MILMFDLFETLVNKSFIDFNRGLLPLWERHYRDKCTFEDIKKYGEELFVLLRKYHSEGREFAFVREELPLYAERYGGEVITMDASEEADFMTLCNGMVPAPGIAELLANCEEAGIPMYVLSNSGFTAAALWTSLDRMGIGQYFANVWSSADFGKIKPNREFYESAIDVILREGRIVSGASSYSRYLEGIEVEVDTVKEERQKGLARVCCATLILQCLSEGLYPSWDAHNPISVHLAETLGYEFSHEYPAYEVELTCRTH